MTKIFRFFYLTWSIVWFLLVMILIFPLVIIGSFFGRIRGGNFIYQLLHLWGDVWFFLAGMRVSVQFAVSSEQSAGKVAGGRSQVAGQSAVSSEQSADSQTAHPHTPTLSHQHSTPSHFHTPTPKQYVFVANHVSNLDAAFLVRVIRQPFRPLGKIELVKVPIFGFIYKAAVVTVDRSDAKHRSRSIKNLKSIIHKGISILIFPEGTFNETGRPMKDCYDGAFRLAIETQTPIKPVIFPDTYARMQGDKVFTLNPGVCRAIWLEEIPVEGLELSDVAQLKQRVIDVMSSALQQYNASWIRAEHQG